MSGRPRTPPPRPKITAPGDPKRCSGLIVGMLPGGPARFAEICRNILGVRERMLSRRLNELVQVDLVERRVLSEPPVGVEYRLAPRGEALRRPYHLVAKPAPI